jgi:hypothetical protein
VKGDRKFLGKKYNKLNVYNKESDQNYLRSIFSNRKSKKDLLDEDLHYDQKLLPPEMKSDESSISDYLKDVQVENNLEKESYWTLMSHEHIRCVFLVMCFLWFTISGTYYGIGIYVKELPGDIFVTVTIIFVFEILSNILSAYMMNNKHLGRKRSITILYICCILFLVLMIFVNRLSNYQNAFTIAIRFFISTMYSINYVYSTEFYPTVIRAKGLAINTLCGRFGAIVSPILVEVFEFNYFLFCLVISVISLAGSFLLKETYNTELKNFIEDI